MAMERFGHERNMELSILYSKCPVIYLPCDLEENEQF